MLAGYTIEEWVYSVLRASNIKNQFDWGLDAHADTFQSTLCYGSVYTSNVDETGGTVPLSSLWSSQFNGQVDIIVHDNHQPRCSLSKLVAANEIDANGMPCFKPSRAHCRVSRAYYAQATALCLDIKALLRQHPDGTDRRKGERQNLGQCLRSTDVERLEHEALADKVSQCDQVSPQSHHVHGLLVQVVAGVYPHDGGDHGVGSKKPSCERRDLVEGRASRLDIFVVSDRGELLGRVFRVEG